MAEEAGKAVLEGRPAGAGWGGRVGWLAGSDGWQGGEAGLARVMGWWAGWSEGDGSSE